jgi:DNA-binding GntR family transcriptional regulator
VIASQVHLALTVDQATYRDPERDGRMHRRLVQLIEEGDEAAIIAEVREHSQASLDELIRRRDQGVQMFMHDGAGEQPHSRP